MSRLTNMLGLPKAPPHKWFSRDKSAPLVSGLDYDECAICGLRMRTGTVPGARHGRPKRVTLYRLRGEAEWFESSVRPQCKVPS